MRKKNKIFILVFTFILASCSSLHDKKDYEHNYVKYWDKYTNQQLIDTLYSDTLKLGDTKDDLSTREFYLNTIQELIADLQDDKNRIDSLFPMKSFNEVTIKRLPFDFKSSFTNGQINNFLEIINDPASFDWAETTYEPEFQIDFYHNNVVVASLTINDDYSVIKTDPEWPEFRKFKFGHIKSEAYHKMVKLLIDVGQ